MSFKEELQRISRYKKDTDKVICNIKDKTRESAENGSFCLIDAYKCEAKNDYHLSVRTTRKPVEIGDINMTEKDRFIYEFFKQEGFVISFDSVDLNPHPSFGEEGYSAAFFMSLWWLACDKKTKDGVK